MYVLMSYAAVNVTSQNSVYRYRTFVLALILLAGHCRAIITALKVLVDRPQDRSSVATTLAARL